MTTMHQLLAPRVLRLVLGFCTCGVTVTAVMGVWLAVLCCDVAGNPANAYGALTNALTSAVKQFKAAYPDREVSPRCDRTAHGAHEGSSC